MEKIEQVIENSQSQKSSSNLSNSENSNIDIINMSQYKSSSNKQVYQQQEQILNRSISQSSSQQQYFQKNINYNYSSKTGIAYLLLTITQFLQVLKEQEYNQFNITLQSYELKTYQPKIRQSLVHFLTTQYHQLGIVDYVKIQEILFQKNSLKFCIKDSKLSQLNYYKKAFIPNQKLLKKSKTSKIISETIQKELTYLQQLKQQFIHTHQKTQQHPSISITDENIKRMVQQDIKSNLKLKIILINFYWRLLQQKLTLIAHYEQNHNEELLVNQENQYKRLIQISSNQMTKKLKSNCQQNPKKKILEDLTKIQQENLSALKNYIPQILLLITKYQQIKNLNDKERKGIEIQMKDMNEYAEKILKCLKIRYFLIKQKAQIISESSNYIQFLFTLQDVIYLMDCLPFHLNLNQFKKYFNLLFEEHHQSIFILLLFIQLTIYNINEFTYSQLHKTQTKQSIKSIQSQKINKQQKQIQCKKLFQTMVLQNYVTICYQFAENKPFDYSLFSPFIENLSYMEKKLRFFLKNFIKVQPIKRIYLETTSIDSKQQKQFKNSKISFGFQPIYRIYADKNWIYEKVRYIIHYSQFVVQILLQMSQNTTITLTIMFNSVRFLICFFICHFWIQNIIKIMNQIQQQNGDFYFHVLIQILQQNIRWNQCKNKFQKILKYTQQRLIGYQSQIHQLHSQNNKKILTNSEKFHKIYNQNPVIKSTFQQLKGKSELNLKELIKGHQNFQTIKNIYTLILFLCITQYSNKDILRKNFEKKVLIISEGEIKEVKKYNLHKKDYQQYLQFLSKYKNQLKLDMLINSKNELDKVEEYQFIVQKFIIYYIETLKLVSMILAMPYFSFQNEIGNLKVKLKKNQNERHGSSILSSLDQLYIIEKKKVKSQIITSVIFQQKSQRFFDRYVSLTNQILQFVFKDDQNTKIEKVKNVSSRTFIHDSFKYPQFIHKDRNSIFTINQCQQYFFKLFNTQILNFDVIQQFKEFYQFILEFNKKGTNILKNFNTTSNKIESKSNQGNFILLSIQNDK